MKPTSPTLSQEELRSLRAGLDAKKGDPEEVLLDNFEFIRRFKINRRTAYNWRRKGLLPFVVIEDKIFYRLSEVRKFIDRNECREFGNLKI